MNTRVLIFTIVIFNIAQLFSQEEKKGRFFGGFESNSQYYLDDNELGDFTYGDRFRSNNYLNLNYNYEKYK